MGSQFSRPSEATTAASAWWAENRDDNGEWIAKYRDSLQVRHREAILEALDAALPWQSVHELGCHCGPNLRLIRQRWPASICTGSDINLGAIAEGREWFKDDPKVSLWLADLFDDLNTPFLVKPDIILSCYTLAYVAPVDLRDVLRRMACEAKRGLIIAEPMARASEAGPIINIDAFTQWSHDYAVHLGAALSEIGRNGIATIRTVSPPVDFLNAVLTVTFTEEPPCLPPL